MAEQNRAKSMSARTSREVAFMETSSPRGRPVRGKPLRAAQIEVDLGPLGERLGYFVRRAQVAIFQDFEATCLELDIRPVQYSILTIIETNPGLSQTSVSEALGIKKTNFVAMLDTLEERGLVHRASPPGDRRTYALFLSAHGKIFMRRLHKLVEGHERRIIEMIGPEVHRRMFAPMKMIAKMGPGVRGRR